MMMTIVRHSVVNASAFVLCIECMQCDLGFHKFRKRDQKKPFIHITHAILSSSCSPLHSINQQFPRTAIYRFEIHSYLVFSFAITALCIGFLAGLKNLTPSHTLNMFKIFCCHKIQKYPVAVYFQNFVSVSFCDFSLDAQPIITVRGRVGEGGRGEKLCLEVLQPQKNEEARGGTKVSSEYSQIDIIINYLELVLILTCRVFFLNDQKQPNAGVREFTKF